MCDIKLMLLSFLLFYVSYLNSYEIITEKNQLEHLVKLIITKQNRYIFIDYEKYFSTEEQNLLKSTEKNKLKEKILYFKNLNKYLKTLSKKDYKIFFLTSQPKNNSNMQEHLHHIAICLHSYHFPHGVICGSSNSDLFLEPYTCAKELFNNQEIGFCDFVLYTAGQDKINVVNAFMQTCSLDIETIKYNYTEDNKPTLRKRNSFLNTSGNNY